MLGKALCILCMAVAHPRPLWAGVGGGRADVARGPKYLPMDEVKRESPSGQYRLWIFGDKETPAIAKHVFTETGCVRWVRSLPLVLQDAVVSDSGVVAGSGIDYDGNARLICILASGDVAVDRAIPLLVSSDQVPEYNIRIKDQFISEGLGVAGWVVESFSEERGIEVEILTASLRGGRVLGVFLSSGHR